MFFFPLSRRKRRAQSPWSDVHFSVELVCSLLCWAGVAAVNPIVRCLLKWRWRTDRCSDSSPKRNWIAESLLADAICYGNSSSFPRNPEPISGGALFPQRLTQLFDLQTKTDEWPPMLFRFSSFCSSKSWSCDVCSAIGCDPISSRKRSDSGTCDVIVHRPIDFTSNPNWKRAISSTNLCQFQFYSCRRFLVKSQSRQFPSRKKGRFRWKESGNAA